MTKCTPTAADLIAEALELKDTLQEPFERVVIQSGIDHLQAAMADRNEIKAIKKHAELIDLCRRYSSEEIL